MKLAIAMLACALTSATALAQQVSVYAFEDPSCAAWVKTAGNRALRAQYEFWIRGFVSGHNYASPSRQVVFGDLPAGEALYDYLDKYCTAEPQATFVAGAITLTEQLRKPVAAAKPKAASAHKKAPAAPK